MATQSDPKSLPAGAKIFIVPMEWNLDGYIRTQLSTNNLPLNVVGDREEADFIMTASSVKLGSRMASPGRDFQIRILTADGATQVWSTEASDYALFFARLRSHGTSRAARSIVRKMRDRFFKTRP